MARHPRQRRILRGDQDGAQRTAGRRRRVDAADGAHLPRTRARQRVATRGRVGLRGHPRPAAGRDPRLRRGHGVAPESTKWIWRCHIDLTDANPQVFEFFRPFVEQYDASVWTMPQFVPDSMPKDRTIIAPPCIDPLSVKNLDLPDPFMTEIVKQYGVRPNDPLLVQVSRFDPWKDPIGVIEAYRIVKRGVPERATRARRFDGHRRPGRLPLLGTGGRSAPRRRERAPALEHPAGRQRADQRVPALGRRRAAEVAARRLRAHGQRGLVEGPARHRRAVRRHHVADRRRR